MTRDVLLALALLPGLAAAETAYVTDQLRLGVHAAADTSDQAFAFLNSGDALEVLSWERPYARIRLADGREGWVRTAFLVRDEPARRRIAAVEAERDRLARQLTDARNNQRAARLAELEKAAATASARADAAAASLKRLRGSYQAARARLDSLAYSLPLPWAVAGAAGAFLLGVALSWWWFDRRSRKRHGGFRIY